MTNGRNQGFEKKEINCRLQVVKVKMRKNMWFGFDNTNIIGGGRK
jgi:hypothetical protein